MDKDEILKYLTNQIDLLQRKAVELTEQRDEIDLQIKKYKELMRYYRGVFEAEQGVGILSEITAQDISDLNEITPDIHQSTNRNLECNNQTRKKSIRWTVCQIMTSVNEPISIRQICHFIEENYPDIANSSQNLYQSVTTSLWKGRSQNIYELVNRGLYRLKREK